MALSGKFGWGLGDNHDGAERSDEPNYAHSTSIFNEPERPE
jgi:hypothetical protein